jgi:hypothetical protein
MLAFAVETRLPVRALMQIPIAAAPPAKSPPFLIRLPERRALRFCLGPGRMPYLTGGGIGRRAAPGRRTIGRKAPLLR